MKHKIPKHKFVCKVCGKRHFWFTHPYCKEEYENTESDHSRKD